MTDNLHQSHSNLQTDFHTLQHPQLSILLASTTSGDKRIFTRETKVAVANYGHNSMVGKDLRIKGSHGSTVYS